MSSEDHDGPQSGERVDKPVPPSNEALLRFLESAPYASRIHLASTNRVPVQRETPVSCPEAESFLRLALGTAQDWEAEKLLAHVANCEPCANMLTKSLHALEGNPSPEELAAIAELAAARVEWQQTIAKELAATSKRKRPVFSRSLLVIGALAASLIVMVSLFIWQRQIHDPEHQLAMAYSQTRTLELRIPGAEYAILTPSTHTRGILGGHDNSYLLEARAHLARMLERSPQDPHALQLKARADLLEERYAAAVDVLDRLLAEGPVSSDLLVDIGTAYYQRGLVSGSELDRSTALDYIRRADELAPTDPVVLYNEALMMEDRGQLMNAVEVWNRFLTVERDSGWAAEGRRKLSVLEQSLNRLKTHDSRIRQMLVTPVAMDALARDPQKLAAVDEELTSMQLDQILPLAYPVSVPVPGNEQARGSPCDLHCQATRRLLKALSLSLESRHNDFWLSDFLALNIDSAPAPAARSFAKATQLLARATREDMTGIVSLGLDESGQAQELFRQLRSSAPSGSDLRKAAEVGEVRAAVEHMFGLQGTANYRECYAYKDKLSALPGFQKNLDRYPWIHTVLQITQKVCGDAPDKRVEGRALFASSTQIAESSHYALLSLRIQGRSADGPQTMGDGETVQRITLSVLRQLYAGDFPPYRIISTYSTLVYVEIESSRLHSAESSLREEIAWDQIAGHKGAAALARLELARIEIKLGATQEAERQITLAHEGDKATSKGKYHGADFREQRTRMARSMLERGDLARARYFLNLAEDQMEADTDSWGKREFDTTKGMLYLAQGNLSSAESLLQADIVSREDRDVRAVDHVTAAAFAQEDHDLYAELAATWLAQGRSPASILALWERFRLRLLDLPITPCPMQQLDCEQPRLIAAQHRLGNSVLTGQILLLDRVLVYRIDKNNITWTQKSFRKQDVLDSAQALERVISSPHTSWETSRTIGAKLSAALLPALPTQGTGDHTVRIEADPALENLSWTVLPTAGGPLGLRYPLAESRSILAADAAYGSKTKLIPHNSNLQPLVIGASVSSDGQPPLPEALTEATMVSQFLRSPNVILGQRATAKNVAASMANASSLHFAGHAEQSEDGTELLLASNSAKEATPWIDGKFLRQHPPRACKLAVLSACSTGTQDASWKHPLQDIVETLSSLGVPDVVATRWQIDSEASVPFMHAFYASLAQGNSAAVALMAARRLQFEQSQYSNPYYWGAYYVTSTDTLYPRSELRASQ